MGKFHKLFWLDTKIFDFGGLLLSIMRLPYFIKNRSWILKNRELRSYKKSDTCYILGLGPSLKDVDFSKLKGDIISVNSFYRMKDQSIQPDYYCIIDNIDYLSEHSTILSDASRQYPNTVFILNGKYKMQAESKINPNVSKYYCFAWGKYFNHDDKVDMCRIMPIMGNVICLTIYMAMYIGYKKIILLGCDFNSFTSRKELHCYEEKDQSKSMSLAYEMFSYSFCADTHMNLYRYAKEHDIEIINATKGSLLDAYPFDKDLDRYYIINNLKEENKNA